MPESLSLSALNVAAVLPELVMIAFVLAVMAVDMFAPPTRSRPAGAPFPGSRSPASS
ncbi:MAG: hypothetical protein R2851_11860 [Caldilineaceae bacterium]